MTPGVTPWEAHSITCIFFLLKNAQIESNHEQTSEKPKLREILQKKKTCLFQKFQCYETLRKKTTDDLKKTIKRHKKTRNT